MKLVITLSLSVFLWSRVDKFLHATKKSNFCVSGCGRSWYPAEFQISPRNFLVGPKCLNYLVYNSFWPLFIVFLVTNDVEVKPKLELTRPEDYCTYLQQQFLLTTWLFCLESDSETARRDLLAELELLKLIDPHPNVIGLLGCCTRQGKLVTPWPL